MNKYYILIFITILLLITIILLSITLNNKKYNKDLNYILTSSVITFGALFLKCYLISLEDNLSNYYFKFLIIIILIQLINAILIIFYCTEYYNKTKNNIKVEDDYVLSFINIIYVIYILIIANGILFLYCLLLLIKKRNNCSLVFLYEKCN
jgi:hypothetical protein